MPCASWEDRLLDYDELSAAELESVRAHVAECTPCREYLEVLRGIDARLTQLYAGARPSPALPKPSLVPEVLDFLGWASVIGFAISVVLLFLPISVLRQLAAAMVTPAVFLAAAIAVPAAAWIGLRSYAELKS